MARLVFDIETNAFPVEQFDAVQQEYLFRDAAGLADPAAQEARRGEIARMLSLWPMTAQVVCIAMLNADSGRGKALFQAEDAEETGDGPAAVEFVPCADETELLTEFWEVAVRYDSIVTFNGRGFDVPFIYMRSALLNVPITRKDWLGYRFAVEPHCDLLEQLNVLRGERAGGGGAAVQPGFLLQGVWDRVAEGPGSDGDGDRGVDGGGEASGDCGVLRAGCVCDDAVV